MSASPTTPRRDPAGVTEFDIGVVDGRTARPAADSIAIEEPLEIQVRYDGDRSWRPLSLTMRTPGDDRELAAGWLLSEGIVRSREEILDLAPWGPFTGEERIRNTIRVRLHGRAPAGLDRLKRSFYTNSSCGVCGKSSIAALLACSAGVLSENSERVDSGVLRRLPALLRQAQDGFDSTGGLHASALFTLDGRLLRVFEDVGRHNALDKIAGALLLDGLLPASDCIVLVSGRVSFELVQKTVILGVPVLCAIGAPSSLAVQVARAASLTLAGFLRDSRFNVYSAPERVRI